MAFDVPADTTATSYASIDDADAAADTRLGSAAWKALTDDDVKQQILTSASLDIDSLDGQRVDGWIIRFLGGRASSTQQLEWPRTGTDYSTTGWPQRLVDATIDLAFWNATQIASNPAFDTVNADPQAFRLKRSKVGPLEDEWFAPSDTTPQMGVERFPGIVQRLLVPLLNYTKIQNSWGGSALVSRGA